MSRFEDLVHGILWLNKRDWGRPLLYGFASLMLACVLAHYSGVASLVIEGPVYRAGSSVGRFVVPNGTMVSRSLFGLGADFTVLVIFWYFGLRAFGRKSSRTEIEGARK